MQIVENKTYLDQTLDGFLMFEGRSSANEFPYRNFVGEVSIYLMTRPFYVQCNFSAIFQYIKLCNFIPVVELSRQMSSC